MVKNIKEVKECPECASQDLVYRETDEQVICRNCGNIYEPLTPEEDKRLEGSEEE